MKFYVKDADGNLVEATSDQILDPDVIKYNEEGKALNKQTATKVEDADPVAHLEGVVKELATQVSSMSSIKERADELEKQVKEAREMVNNGFVMPSANIQPGMNREEMDKEILYYNQKRQGVELFNRFAAKGHVIPDDTKREMAKFFSLFVRAGLCGDPAAYQKFRREYPISPIQKTTIGDTGNAFPIPDIVESEILHFTRERSVVLQDATLVPMISEKQSYPVETSGPSVGWGNTTAQSDPAADAANECELSAVELSAYSSAKNMTLADSRSDIVGWIADSMAEAAAQEIDNEGFNGDGYASDGVCSGMFSTAGYSVVMASGSTAFSMVSASNLSEMISKLDGLKKQGAKYYMHGEIIHYVRSLTDDNNRPIFMETIGSPVPPSIWGYPYKECIKCPSTSAANTSFVIFGNLKYFYVGRRLDSAALIVDPYGLFTTNRTRFKLYQRWGMKTALANGLVKLVTAT